MAVRGQDFVSILRQQIEQFGAQATMVEVGTVVEVGDGIARIHGLSGARYNELLEFSSGAIGMALNLDEDSVGAVVLGEYSQVKEGEEVHSTSRVVEVPVGEELIGRIVNPLGQPVDGSGPIKAQRNRPVETVAPNVVARQPVNVPLHTGIKAIDGMVPIGRGQRELIIGDRSTGKSALALDTILSQKETGVICIYVAIGQKTAKVAQTVATLEQYGAMDHTIVVAANSAEPAGLLYLAPYAGCAMGEELMGQGRDALVIYDDLTKHAWSYRQLSLLLRRPAGREAFPGDIFYLHSRLLERAAKLSDEHGGGSLTALPVVETQAGDISAYIPTNIISITDGQIYLETDLFNAGIRPAINAGLSVSRVGGAAQTRAMKKVAGRLRMELAQYRELAAFAQFGTSELDRATRMQLERGMRLTEILKQPQWEPMAMTREVSILFAAVNGFIDDVSVENLGRWEEELHRFMETRHPDIVQAISSEKDISDKTEAALRDALSEFKQTVAL